MATGFRIAARALRQLGAELITSDDIALNELIKNAFDAKSERVEVFIASPFKFSVEKLLEAAEKWSGSKDQMKIHLEKCLLISLSDSLKTTIINEFLNSHERNPKQKLETVIRKFNYIRISDTGEGMTADELEDNFLVVGTPVKWIQKKSDPSITLLGEKGVGRLSMMRLGRFATLTSSKEGGKFSNYVKFDWNEFDDPKKYLEDIEINVNSKYKAKAVDEKGTIIEISALNEHWTHKKASDFVSNYLRRIHNPFETKKLRFPVDINFNGERIDVDRMPLWLKNSANFQAKIQLAIDTGNDDEKVFTRKLKWFGKETYETRKVTLAELTHKLGCEVSDLVDLGPITIDCLWFNRTDWKKDTHDKGRPDFIKELNIWCGGFTLYRDSFRIGVTGSLENDWLKMDQSSLTSQGFTFNRYQTVGSLSITQRDNPNLVDAANREQLIDSPALVLLKKLMEELVIPDLKSHISVIKEAEEKGSIAKLTTHNIVRESLKRLDSADDAVKSLKTLVPPEAKEDLREIREVLKFQRENVRQFQHAVKLATEQKVELLELAGIGMVVDKVVHELARLTANTAESLRSLEEGGHDPKKQLAIIKIIKEQMKVTNKRIRSVDALSPSGRNKKDKFNLIGLIETIFAGYEGRFTRHGVISQVLVDGVVNRKSYEVNMVIGLVAQIIENLLSNSLYWLQQSLLEGETHRKVTVEIDTESRSIMFFDNGPGIAPEYAEEIFLPYYSTRPRGKGLGLFIAKELANYHQANLYLDKTPDGDGRLRCFILELPKGN